MHEDLSLSLDEQAKWEFIQEVDRYHRKLRQIETVKAASPELFREASQEHLERMTAIYAASGSRRHQDAPPWISTFGLKH